MSLHSADCAPLAGKSTLNRLEHAPTALADRYQARTLLCLSLLATAAGGLVMMTFPPASTMLVLYAFWGVTSILLLWGALIRATREWGGADQQGRAFGLLEAGRGVIAAAVAYVALKVFAWNLADGVVDDVVVAAVLAALRAKGETVPEITGLMIAPPHMIRASDAIAVLLS